MSVIAKLSEVSVKRGTTSILRDLNWQIRANERWAVLGPNGAGKTTLLHLLSGYIFPASGSVEVTGIGFEPYLGVDETRAGKLMAEWNLLQLSDKRISEISDGERKRLLIARALMPNPELLLLDEPTAALDLGSREHLLQILQRLCLEPNSPSMVIVTHHVEEIPSGITHVLLMRDGKSIASGPIDQVISSVTLSATYGVPVNVHQNDGRWFAVARVK